ncbi:MAG: CBS domain-containing protein [Caldilineaceae bacterium]|nr:CBS domain-containing protein [Caldilineaceae bacterium]MBP8106329.1 CBS domain-containing protein [Caldilineaceae bacterium]MBP9071115.1 CBS domain-containing protein [Caldilineaceae bacterium]
MTLSVILTHEYTDFDALASLLGAHLLYPHALPVLPRQMNRNVREFAHLFKGALPFIEPEDLPKHQHVDDAILVDTRSANWVRGMDDTTRVLVIDHHQDQEEDEAAEEADAPDVWETPAADASRSHWRFWTDDVGANTTILVEQIRERAIRLTSSQATLLALGIYEDTGNLTYRATTARDVICVAWLLDAERGANLEVIARFLRHPLSEEQRKVYQTLVDNSEHLTIDGNRVVVACADAPGFKDEISTLAHKLRNLYEPDALFLIVDLGDRVQVVARSTSDGVDVGAIATALGGGGHDRAAAAPVRGMTVADVRARIIDLCRTHSRPASTVRHLMTLSRPQTLDAALPIHLAHDLMRRYGHEGYPVVATGPDGSQEQILGIITRQEVDRAMGHGLGNVSVAKYMREGRFTVTPDDSVATLRQLMVESGWGQIPVVGPGGELIGIVTRTDLIKLWEQRETPADGRGQMGQRLREALPPVPYRLLRVAGQAADAMQATAYVVGGFVRDLLLNDTAWRVDSLDLDIVIEGDAILLAEGLQAAYGGRLVSHRRFGTAKWLLTDPDFPVNRPDLLEDLPGDLPEFIDFITARTEFYTEPTALPTVERSSIKLDLHRRDFTINTLALNLDPDQWGELLDFYNGAADLAQGRIRVLHSLSFVDDPTRILRAVRYEQRFDFQIGPRTLDLLRDATELLDKVSPARIRHELDRILQEKMPEKTLARLGELNILAQLHPHLAMTPWATQTFSALRMALADLESTHLFDPPGLAAIRSTAIERLYWGILVYAMPGPPLPEQNEQDPNGDTHLAERLGLRKETQNLVADLRKLQAQRDFLHQPDLLPSQVVHALDRIAAPARFLFRLLEPDLRLRAYLDRYETEWQQIVPLLDGVDLQKMGLRRGPLFRTILDGLRAARLDGRLHSRAGEEALALQIAQTEGVRG